MTNQIQKDVLLKNFCTFQIGGPAKYFCGVKTESELATALSWAQQQGEKIFLLGSGSNVLFSDQGFDGLVIHLENDQIQVKTRENDANSKKIICQAGAKLSQLVSLATQESLQGLAWAIGIPGTVGGAIRGNAGAFSGEMKDHIQQVRVFDIKDPTKSMITLEKDQCEFEYRGSLFKKQPQWLIWDAVFELKKGNKAEIQKQLNEIMAQRKEKQPNLAQVFSAGSIFKNPTVEKKILDLFEQDKETKLSGKNVPAAWLIDRCGLKGKTVGGAQISQKQANFILNQGQATANDVLMLMSIAKQKVRNTFSVQLQEEIEVVL